jgi:trigger factor
MTVTIENTSPVEAKIRIQVPSQIVSERLNSYYASLGRQAKVPGFRPGKAPTHVVKQMYGSEVLSDVSERLIAEFLGKAIDEHKLDLVMPPMLLATDLPAEDKDFQFEVEVHLKPQIEKLNLDQLQIEVPAPQAVTDQEVDQELERAREADATFVDILELRPANSSDCVVVTYKGNLDGVEDPRMAAQNQTAIMGQNRFLPDFEKAIVGMKIGETKTFDCSFPADYHEASLQGKVAQFTLTLNAIKSKKLPELNDEFAKGMDPDVKDLSELRAKMKKQLEDNRHEETESQKKELVGDALVASHPLTVSQRQVESYAQRLAEQTHQMMHQMGMHHEETEEHAQQLLASSRKKAERDIKLSYVLETIARENKFEVSADDLKKRFERTAARTGYSITQIQQYYAGKDEGDGPSRMERLKIDIMDEKSLDYALSKATIKLKE